METIEIIEADDRETAVVQCGECGGYTFVIEYEKPNHVICSDCYTQVEGMQANFQRRLDS